MCNQHEPDRQEPDANDRKKPEHAADDAENAQRQPPAAPVGMAHPADGPAQADLLFQPIERAIEQVAGVVVTIVDHTNQALRVLRCSDLSANRNSRRAGDPRVSGYGASPASPEEVERRAR